MIVIHIGNAKSGSSTIQKFLSDNRKALLDLSVFFPEVADTTNHVNLAWEINQSRHFDSKATTLTDIAHYWRESSSDTMILSSELFEFSPPSRILHLKNALSGARQDEEFRIILIIRDLVDLMPSSYAQKVKFGHNDYDFDTFFDQRMEEDRVDYFRTAEKWADVFGWSSLRVRSLDPAFLHNGDLIDDFLAVSDVDVLNPGVVKMPRVGVRNVRPGWRLLEAFRALHNGAHGLPAENPALKAMRKSVRTAKNSAQDKILGRVAMKVAENLGWNNDKGLYLTRAQAQICLEMHCTAIDVLNRHLGQKLPPPQNLDERGFIERNFLPDVSHIAKPDLINFYDQIAESSLKKLARAKRSRKRK